MYVLQDQVRRSVYSVLRATCSRNGGVCRPVHLATTLEKQQDSLIRCVTGDCNNVVSRKLFDISQSVCGIFSLFFIIHLCSAVFCHSVSPGVKKTVLAAEVLDQLALNAKRVTV